MAKYLVGTLQVSGTSTGLIFQDASIAIEADTAEVKDENGNVAYVQHYNHRCTISANAVCPKGEAQPCTGATISIKGVTLPTPAADGSMTSPTINLEADSSSTGIDFLVQSANLSSSNSDVDKYAITLVRYLENGLGAIKTATA